MPDNNLFVSLGARAAHEHLSYHQMDAALRSALPSRFAQDPVRFTDGDIDALHEAFDRIRDVSLPYDVAFGIDMVCAIIPDLWQMLHGQLASIWLMRAMGGDQSGNEVYELHRRAFSGEKVSIDEFWKCRPWLPGSGRPG